MEGADFVGYHVGSMRRLRIGAIALLSLGASLAQAAPDKSATTPSMAAEKSQIKPAEEKSIGGDGKTVPALRSVPIPGILR